MAHTFRVLIADDEAPARSKLIRMLEGHAQLEIVAEVENGTDALAQIQEINPDIAFLDIQMPGMTGLEVAEKLQELDVDAPYLVFATAYDEHAIRAFELRAIDYLLKPFNQERLEQTLAKILEELEDDAATRNGETPAANVEFSAEVLRKIPIPTADRFRLISYDEVVCIEVQDRMTHVHTLSKAYPINQTLEAFERKLPAEQFMRVSRSCIVNVEAIHEIVLWFGNRYKLVLSNDKEVVSSRERSKILKKMLKF